MNRLAIEQVPRARDIVCFWKQNDLGLFGRRADRWLQYWTKQSDVERIWVVEPPIGWLQLIGLLKQSVQFEGCTAREPILLLNQILRKSAGFCDSDKLRFLSLVSLEPLAPSLQADTIIDRLRDAGVQSPVVVIWPCIPFTVSDVERLEPIQVITDMVDDQRQFRSNQHQIDVITQQYAGWMARSDLVLSNSPAFVSTLESEFLRSVFHLPNSDLPRASDDDEARAASAHGPCKRLDVFGHPFIAGYIGNLRERIDVPRLLELMCAHPDWQFWFVGQVARSELYLAAKGLANCRFFGARPLHEARILMSRFKLALIPFRDDALTRSMSLLKSEEYQTAGLPVVDFRVMDNDEVHRLFTRIRTASVVSEIRFQRGGDEKHSADIG